MAIAPDLPGLNSPDQQDLFGKEFAGECYATPEECACLHELCVMLWQGRAAEYRGAERVRGAEYLEMRIMGVI